jgi:diaminopimelate decarboxylase
LTASIERSADPAATRALLELFPDGTTLDPFGELVIGGCTASDLAGVFGTPTLVIEETAMRHRVRRYADGLAMRWPNSKVVWASKSLPYTAVYRLMSEERLGIDVSGGGEIVMALTAGADPADLVVHGNAKTDDEIAMAVRAGAGTIVVDNFDDIDRLERLVTDTQGVLVRVNPGIKPKTHDAIATGQGDAKFGLSHADARTAIARLRGSNNLRLDGLHVHIGSQIVDTEPFTRSIEALADLGDFSVYNLGGGLGARYTYDERPPSIEDYLDTLTQAAARVLPSASQLLIEPGRSLVAEVGVTLYRVVTVKRGERTFVAVDGGMSDNLEVSLYGQRFEATIATRVGGGENCSLVGRHCESGDRLIDGVLLRDPQVGDLVAVPVTGAYCLTMANNYNGACRPPIVFASDGEPRMVLRRETYDDLLRRDLDVVAT